MFPEWRAPAGPKYLVAVIVLFVAVAFGAAGSAPGDDLVPDLEVSFSASVGPSKLPARGTKPVRLALRERIWNVSGAHPPALQGIDFDFDRHLDLSVKGLPVCHPHMGGRDQREEIFSQCEEAEVGSGTMEVEVAFPEQAPVQVSGRVGVYNFGVHDGHTMFLLYTYLSAPVTGVIATPLEVRRRAHGIYGWEGRLTVPKIANGAGSITYLGLHLDKGIFSAGCPTKMLWARALSRFADGTATAVSTIQRCRLSASG